MAEAPSAPPVEVSAPSVESESSKPQAEQLQGGTEKLSDGSDLNALAEGLNATTVDVDAEFAKLAGEGGDKAFGQAPKDADQQRDTPDVRTEQEKIDRIMAMKPDELQALADKGDVDAQRALDDIQRYGEKGTAGVEDFLKQQAEGPTATAPSEQNAQTQAPEANATPAVEAQQQPTTPEAETPPVAAETATANPPLVEATAEGVVAEAEEAQQKAVAENDTQTEATAEEVKSPEQQAKEQQVRRDQFLKELVKANPDFDVTSEMAQQYLDTASESKENIDAIVAMNEHFLGEQAEKTAEKMGMNVKDMAKDSVNGLITDIEQKFAALKKALAEGDTTKQEELDKTGWMLKILKAFGAALIIAGAALNGAAVGVNAVAGASKK